MHKLIEIVVALISVPYDVATKDINLPLIIKNVPARQVFRINENELRKLTLRKGTAKACVADYSEGKFIESFRPVCVS